MIFTQLMMVSVCSISKTPQNYKKPPKDNHSSLASEINQALGRKAMPCFTCISTEKVISHQKSVLKNDTRYNGHYFV